MSSGSSLSRRTNGKRFPSATSKTNAIEKTPDGYTYLDPTAFPKAFAADLPPEHAEFEAHAQILTAAGVFTAPVTDPAWKVKPSWALVADADKIINPDLERFHAARAHSHVVEVTGASHSVYESRSKEVAALIEEAAQLWPERVLARPCFQQIPAVQHQDVHEIKPPLILQPGPAALTDGLAELQEIIQGWAVRE
jgi:hypothetical protein